MTEIFCPVCNLSMKAGAEIGCPSTFHCRLKESVTCLRCDQQMEDADQAEGCEDPGCPIHPKAAE